MQSEWRVASRT